MDGPVLSNRYSARQDKSSSPLSTGRTKYEGSSSNAQRMCQRRRRRRRALADRTNDSPIFGLVPGIPTSPSFSICSLSEGSSVGEDLLRSQVKSLLRKIEQEGTRFPYLRTLSQLNGCLHSPSSSSSSKSNSFNQPIGLPTTPTLLFGQSCRIATAISRFQGCSTLEAEVVDEGRSGYVDLGIHSPEDSSASEAELQPQQLLPSGSQSRGSMYNKCDQSSRAAKSITRILHFESPEKPSNSSIHPSSNSSSSCRSSCLDPEIFQIECGAKLKELSEVHKVLVSLGKRVVSSEFKQMVENADGPVVGVSTQKLQNSFNARI